MRRRIVRGVLRAVQTVDILVDILETRRVHTLADTSPLGQLCKKKGSSEYQQDNCKNTRQITEQRGRHTVNALPVMLFLLIEDGVLVLGQHFLLTRHLRIPPLDSLCTVTVARKGSIEGFDDAVDGAQALALSGFLGRRETPRGLPVSGERMLLVLQAQC